MADNLEALRRTLVHAAASFDRANEERSKRSKRGHYNPYALAQYLVRIDEALDQIANGATLRAALLDCFNDRLCDHLLKAVGEPSATER